MTEDIAHWDPELQTLAAQYGPATVKAAFAVANDLEQNGYPGIFYMEKAEQKVDNTIRPTAWSKTDSALRKELRSKGFQVR
jgi:hypothetical protein